MRTVLKLPGLRHTCTRFSLPVISSPDSIRVHSTKFLLEIYEERNWPVATLPRNAVAQVAKP